MISFLYFFVLFITILGLRCCAWTFSSCSKWGLLASCSVVGLSLQWLLLLQHPGSRGCGFSSQGMWAQYLQLMGSRAQAQKLWCLGLVVLWHVGSSQTRDQTHVSFIGRQILSHWATRETQEFLMLHIMLHRSGLNTSRGRVSYKSQVEGKYNARFSILIAKKALGGIMGKPMVI